MHCWRIWVGDLDNALFLHCRVTVENFKSIREAQTLSFDRSPRLDQRGIDGSDALPEFETNPVAAIVGPNASGKTTVIAAIQQLGALVTDSADIPVGASLPFEPFAFSEEASEAPTRFHIHFATAAGEYSFEVAYSESRIVHEELVQYVTSESGRTSSRKLYVRDGDTIKPGRFLRGAKRHIVDATRPNMLFLSKAAKENMEQLLEPFLWFADLFPEGEENSSVSRFIERSEFKKWVTSLLRMADLGISAVQLDRPPVSLFDSEHIAQIAHSSAPEDLREVEERLVRSLTQPRFAHNAQVGGAIKTVFLKWSAESTGTKLLWQNAGMLFDSLQSGALVLIDEFTGLHPVVKRAIIMLFQSPETNPNGAQLVFTTHDTALIGRMGSEGRTLAVDQIWFTEKGADGATSLWPLTDFKLRGHEDIQKYYLTGRFDALPFIDRFGGVE